MAKILFVNRDEDERITGKRVLERYIENSRVITAYDLPSAESFLAHDKFDLVIFDEDRSVSKVWSNRAAELFAVRQKVLIVSADDDNRRDRVPFLNRDRYEELVNMTEHLLGTPLEVLVR